MNLYLVNPLENRACGNLMKHFVQLLKFKHRFAALPMDVLIFHQESLI